MLLRPSKKKNPTGGIRRQPPGRLQNANPREFTRFRPLRPSKYHAPVRLQNANPREFTRFKPLRPSKYQPPGSLQNANPREFTRFRPLRVTRPGSIREARKRPGTVREVAFFFGVKGFFDRKKSIKINATFFAANFVPKS